MKAKNVTDYPYINSQCINCGVCVPPCPCPGTIIWDDIIEGYRIRVDQCLGCACDLDCFEVCPVGAILWFDEEYT